MKKLANLRCYVAIGKDEYCDTSIWNHIRYVEENECNTREYTFETFEEASAAVADKQVKNASTYNTLFGNKPAIEFSFGRLENSRVVLTKKTFKPVRVKWEWEEVEVEDYTMKNLASILPAEQFCEWLKDHGITMVGSM